MLKLYRDHSQVSIKLKPRGIYTQRSNAVFASIQIAGDAGIYKSGLYSSVRSTKDLPQCFKFFPDQKRDSAAAANIRLV